MKYWALGLLMGVTAQKVGELNCYSLRNDNFYASFFVTDHAASINLSTAHFMESADKPKGFNVSLNLLKNGEATLEYIDQDMKVHSASLKKIIDLANK